MNVSWRRSNPREQQWPPFVSLSPSPWDRPKIGSDLFISLFLVLLIL